MRSLPLTTAIEIKRLLAAGRSQVEIARLLDISQGTVSRVSLGYVHHDAPWPDGSTGAFNPDIHVTPAGDSGPAVADASRPKPTIPLQAIDEALDELYEEEEQEIKGILRDC